MAFSTLLRHIQTVVEESERCSANFYRHGISIFVEKPAMDGSIILSRLEEAQSRSRVGVGILFSRSIRGEWDHCICL